MASISSTIATGRAKKVMGQAIRELGWKRSDIVISNKIFWVGSGHNDKGLSRKHIIEGWAYYWGTSEWSAQQITQAWSVAQRLGLIGPVVEQPEYNLLTIYKVEFEYLPLYTNYGIGLTTWSPLASGVLTGKYTNGHIPKGSRFSLTTYKFCACMTTFHAKDMKIEENMKAINVIPLLTLEVMSSIEAVVQTKPKVPNPFR